MIPTNIRLDVTLDAHPFAAYGRRDLPVRLGYRWRWAGLPSLTVAVTTQPQRYAAYNANEQGSGTWATTQRSLPYVPWDRTMRLYRRGWRYTTIRRAWGPYYTH